MASNRMSCGRLAILLVCLGALTAGCAARQQFSHLRVPLPVHEASTLVIGIVGGRDSWDIEHRGVTRLAARLREASQPGVFVDVVQHRRRDLIPALVRQAFPPSPDGRDVEPRVILYGMSFGGAAVLAAARDLREMGVPVLLTVQVDSVGRHDGVVPDNVRCAVNLYQRDGPFVRGQRRIDAEDPAVTEILGSFRFRYRGRPVDMAGVGWFRRTFLRSAHLKMNLDPEVWGLVEEMIVSRIEDDVCRVPEGLTDWPLS